MEFLHRTWAEIDLDALKNNFKILKEKAGDCKLMAVVKADAYGHSAEAIAPVLEKSGADYFAVSNITEALNLRKYGIKKPILILGYTPPENADILANNNISQCVYSTEYAKELSAFASRKNVTVKIHIKLDTGMSRIGFNCRSDELSEIHDAFSCSILKGFCLEGIFTHFAVSDRTEQTEDGFTDSQFKRFMLAVNFFESKGSNPPFIHCCNSAGFLLDCDKHLSLSRIGISLYGLSPSSALHLKENFSPVMTLKSVVSMVKEIQKGDTVNYGRTFKADKNLKIATVTVGYADGYPRCLSNKGYVLINGVKAPIVGRICMDQMSVDVTKIPNVKMGDEVLLFGKELSVDVLADLCGTINYEIVCGISPRVPRIIKNG